MSTGLSTTVYLSLVEMSNSDPFTFVLADIETVQVLKLLEQQRDNAFENTEEAVNIPHSPTHLLSAKHRRMGSKERTQKV